MPRTHDRKFREENCGFFSHGILAQTCVAYTRSHKIPTVKNAVTYNTTTTWEKWSSMIPSMRQIDSEHACFFAHRNCIQTVRISDENFSRRKIWEPALKFLLLEIPTEKVRWGLHTVGISDQKLTSNVRPRTHDRTCLLKLVRGPVSAHMFGHLYERTGFPA